MTENYDGAAPTRDPDTVETDAHADRHVAGPRAVAQAAVHRQRR